MHNFHFTLLLKKIPKIKELILNFYMWGITFYPLKKILSSKFRVYPLINTNNFSILLTLDPNIHMRLTDSLWPSKFSGPLVHEYISINMTDLNG